MKLRPGSVILGLGLAVLVPLMSRAFRPLTVRLTVGAMDALQEARRAVSKQMETLEDVAAEARAVRQARIDQDVSRVRKSSRRGRRHGGRSTTGGAAVAQPRSA